MHAKNKYNYKILQVGHICIQNTNQPTTEWNNRKNEIV